MTTPCPNCGSSWMGDGGYCDICRTHATPEQVAAARHYFDKLARFSTWKLMLAAEQKGSK